MASSRKTRSQLALPELDPNALRRSPFKQARMTVKHNVDSPPTPMADIGQSSTHSAKEDHDVPAKRPSSPLKDTVALRERELKRARHGLDDESTDAQPAEHFPRSPKKPSSTSSAPSPSREYTPVRLQRAQSVPPETATPVPHLDLNRIPPSPWRTPGIKLRITTVPSMDAIPDVSSETRGPPSEDIVMATPTTGSSSLRLPLPETTLQALDTSTSSSDAPPPSSPLPSLPTSPADEKPPIDDLILTPRRPESSSSVIPMSPLTPLPNTPWVSKTAPAAERSEEKPPEGMSEHVLRPKTPVATSSRLPRLATGLQVSTSSSNSEVKPPAASRVRSMKARQPPAPIPLGGRMTRSASLRQKDTKKKDDHPTTETATKGAARSNNASALGLGVPSAAAPSQAKTPGRRRSMSFSYAMPTSSSAAKSNPGSPTKPHSTANASFSNIRSFNFSRMTQPPSSSLSNLSQALEKLNMPPPSRPNTSMGFNRDIRGDTDDEDDAPTTSTLSKDDANIAMRSNRSDSSSKRAVPLKRSNTVGTMGARLGSSSKPQTQMHSKLMLPPPVPKARLATAPSSSSSSSAEGPKRINLHSGIIAGKPKGPFVFGSKAMPSRKTGIFAAGTLTGAGANVSRVVHRVSKQSSLPMVEGSPVKGGAPSFMREDTDMEDSAVTGPSRSANDEVKDVTNDMDMFFQGSSGDAAPAPPGEGSSASVPLPSTNGEQPSLVGDKPREPGVTDSWKTNASRRASMASQLLSQSLSALPQTPPKPVAPASEGKGKGRAGLRSASSTFPSSSQGMQTAPGALGKAGSSGTSDGAHVSKTKPGGAGGSTSGSLKVLKDCTIFVDVRTDNGDDAGGLFVDMLKGLGAKMLTRVGQTCTHIVYKRGLMSTLTRYRLLHEPLPLVVGIAWVVECVEQRTRVDEQKFLVDLELVNVAGVNKRRRSMLPKSLSDSNMGPPSLSPLGSADGKAARTQDQSTEASGSSPVVVLDDSPKGNADDLTPLERARRRHNTIKNMFSRAS